MSSSRYRGSYSPPPTNAFSDSPRGKKLARAYPPLNVVRQKERDALYERTSGRARTKSRSRVRQPLPSFGNSEDARTFKPTAAQLAAMCDDDCDGCAKCDALIFSDKKDKGNYTYGHILRSLLGGPSVELPPTELSGGRPAPTSSDILKYPSNCSNCSGYATYCHTCSPIAGQCVVRLDSEIQKYKDMINGAGMEIATSIPSQIFELEGDDGKQVVTHMPAKLDDAEISKRNNYNKYGNTAQSWTLTGPFLESAPHLAPVNSHKRRAAETPFACAQSFNGTPIWCIVDTAASTTKISPAILKKAYPGIKIINDRAAFYGVGGARTIATGRVDLKMIWTGTDGRQVLTNGEAWVAAEGDMEDIGCHVLLGLPYMRDNVMNLSWTRIQRKTKTGSRLPQQLGDKLEIKGVAVEIYIGS